VSIRRAPHLGPQERLAPYVTRLGRFRALDPSRGRPLPGLPQVLAFLGWAALLALSFRRAGRVHAGR